MFCKEAVFFRLYLQEAQRKRKRRETNSHTTMEEVCVTSNDKKDIKRHLTDSWLSLFVCVCVSVCLLLQSATCFPYLCLLLSVLNRIGFFSSSLSCIFFHNLNLFYLFVYYLFKYLFKFSYLSSKEGTDAINGQLFEKIKYNWMIGFGALSLR